MHSFRTVLSLAVALSAQYVRTAPAALPQASPSVCSTSGPAQTISVPQSQPASAVQVPGNFIGFGFDTGFLTDYSNTFSQNLVTSVQNRVGQPIILRVGGTTGDRVYFNPGQTQPAVCVSGPCPVGPGATFILGPSYFNGFKAFPNQHWTFQAPLGPTVNYTGSLDYVTRAYAAAGASRVDAIAIGNEPNLYGGSYTGSTYVSAALALEQRIAKTLGLGASNAIFEVLDLYGGAAGSTFDVQNTFGGGLDSRKNVKYAAQHWYQSPNNLPSYGPAQLQYYLMNHTAITSMFATGYAQAIAYLKQYYPSVGFVLSETGSSLVGPPENYNDGFGACLWYLDFNLYSMSQGVKRVDGTQRPAAVHSLWVPDTIANSPSYGVYQNIGPQVRAPYYATPMLADFLGKSSGSVVQLLGQDTLTAYALYSGGALSKVVLVNLNYWSADTGGTRGNVTFQVPVGSSVSQVTVGRLHAAYGAHALGYDAQGSAGTITWQGETWSYQLDNGAGSQVSGVQQTETVTVCNGVANVVVPATEAVVVYMSSGS